MAFSATSIAVTAALMTAGFQTPSLAFGADFIMEIEGMRREDLPG